MLQMMMTSVLRDLFANHPGVEVNDTNFQDAVNEEHDIVKAHHLMKKKKTPKKGEFQVLKILNVKCLLY